MEKRYKPYFKESLGSTKSLKEGVFSKVLTNHMPNTSIEIYFHNIGSGLYKTTISVNGKVYRTGVFDEDDSGILDVIEKIVDKIDK